MSAKMSSSLPTGDGNGLAAIASDLVENPNKVHVVVALIDCMTITQNTDTGDVIPTTRVRRIEVVTDPEDGRRMRTLLRREFERRTGKTVLPFELEDEMRRAFGEDAGGDG